MRNIAYLLRVDEEAKRARDRAYYRRNAERIKQRVRAYAAAHKEQTAAARKIYGETHRDELNRKALELYHRDPSKQAARNKKWKAKNRDRLKQQARALRQTDPARYVAYARKHQKAYPHAKRERDHRYRARKNGAFVEKVDPEAIYARDRGICQICKRPVAQNRMSLDHIQPLSLGGTHEARNVQLAHRRCNNRRWVSGPAQTRLI